MSQIRATGRTIRRPGAADLACAILLPDKRADRTWWNALAAWRQQAPANALPIIDGLMRPQSVAMDAERATAYERFFRKLPGWSDERPPVHFLFLDDSGADAILSRCVAKGWTTEAAAQGIRSAIRDHGKHKAN